MQNINKNIATVLNSSDSNMRSILRKVAFLEQINQRLQTMLEPWLAQGCHVANIREGCLILQIDNAALTTRLRYQIPTLLSQLRKDASLAGLTSIRCIVRPAQNVDEPVRTIQKPSLVKQATIEQIANSANYVADTIVANALRKLAQTLAGKQRIPLVD